MAKVRIEEAKRAARAELGEEPESLERLHGDCRDFMRLNAAAVGDRSTRHHVLMAEAEQQAAFEQATLDAYMGRIGYTRTTTASEPSGASEPYDTSVFAAMRASASGGGGVGAASGTSGGAPAGPAKKTRAPRNKPRPCSNCGVDGHLYFECKMAKTQETLKKIADYERRMASQGGTSAAQLEREVAEMTAATARKRSCARLAWALCLLQHLYQGYAHNVGKCKTVRKGRRFQSYLTHCILHLMHLTERVYPSLYALHLF